MRRFTPKLTAPLPEGWFAKEKITLHSPDGQANLSVSSEPLDPIHDTLEYAISQGYSMQKAFSAYLELAFEPYSIFGGRQGYIRHFEWTPQDGVPVAQLQVYYVESGRGYTATATTSAAQYKSVELEFLILLQGLKIDHAPGVTTD